MVPDGADDLLGPLLQRVEQAQAAQRAGTVRLPFEFMAMEALLVTVLPRAARARDRPGTGCGGSSLPHGACQKLCVKSCAGARGHEGGEEEARGWGGGDWGSGVRRGKTGLCCSVVNREVVWAQVSTAQRHVVDRCAEDARRILQSIRRRSAPRCSPHTHCAPCFD